MNQTYLKFYNRYSQSIEKEAICGEKFLRWTYESAIGQSVLEWIVKRGFFSFLMGMYMDLPFSKKAILPFVRRYQVNPDEFEIPVTAFKTFNEFFYRKLKPFSRPIHAIKNSIIFPSDGRHLGFPSISDANHFFVKGKKFNVRELVGDEKLAKFFEKGTLILSRLCPTDYHRFHFPCDGMPGPAQMINGPLYSVNPIAIQRNARIFLENKRMLTLLTSKTLGKIALIEVGATCVGSMVQTFKPKRHVKKGDEKGYFRFGGSSTILLFEPNKIQLTPDLISNTQNGLETYAHMGDIMGTSIG